MFLSQSEIRVEPDQVDALEAAFVARSRRVDEHDGFLGLELLRDVSKKGAFVLITRWETRAHFRAYLKSRDFKLAHQRQHDGVVEPTGGAPLRQFERVDLDDAR